MNFSYKELSTGLYDKKMRAELRKNPKEFLSDDSPFKNAQKYKVITSKKEVTYIPIPHHTTLPLSKITAGEHSLTNTGTLSSGTSTSSTMSTQATRGTQNK